MVLQPTLCLNIPRMTQRQAKLKRITNETRVTVRLKLDGAGQAAIRTGIPFLDHMLALFAKHAVLDLSLRCQGDLAVDAHHTVEDCGLALGQAFAQALGDKKGLRRTAPVFIRATRSQEKPTCRWTSVWRGA